MTTETRYRDSRAIAAIVAERERQLDELRTAMRAREAKQPGTPEFEEALARESALIERIHEWALGPETGPRKGPT